jgi:hypothetical protein
MTELHIDDDDDDDDDHHINVAVLMCGNGGQDGPEDTLGSSAPGWET